MLGWKLVSFNSLNISLHFLLSCMVSDEEPSVILILVSLWVGAFVRFGFGLGFLFYSGFTQDFLCLLLQFEIYIYIYVCTGMHMCMFYVYLAWHTLTLLYL